MYAIIDIETTGGSAVHSRITEIAIYIFDGKKVTKQFESLINPECHIPYQITQLTGISNDMVQNAPKFGDLASIIDEITQDQIFVAHNVNFDYNFVREEFRRIGISFKRKKLCTVRLSRKIIPGKYSYSLGKLCASENIGISNRHRAAGDAIATVELFKILLARDKENFIEKSLKPQSLESLIPPNVNKEAYLSLPEKQGLYYFLNQKKEIIYIGKAKNIKKRIHSHFSGTSNTGSKNDFNTNLYDVDFKLIENDLLLNIIEATEIKKHWPRYNKAMKRISLNYGLYIYEDRAGYKRLSIGKCGKHDHPIKASSNEQYLKEFLKEMVIHYNLCPRLSGLQPLASGKCNYVEDLNCQGACCGEEEASTYNQRVQDALETNVYGKSSFLIKEPVPEKAETALVLIENGRYKGYAQIKTLPKEISLSNIKNLLAPAYDDQDMSMLVHSYLEKVSPEHVHFFN